MVVEAHAVAARKERLHVGGGGGRTSPPGAAAGRTAPVDSRAEVEPATSATPSGACTTMRRAARRRRKPSGMKQQEWWNQSRLAVDAGPVRFRCPHTDR